MRTLALKLFALSYRFRILGNEFSQLRATVIIFPLFLLTMIAFKYEVFFLKLLFGIPLFISIFFGFVYFRFRPIEYYKSDLFVLDESQKNQYMMYQKMQTDNGVRDNKWLFFINPLFIIIFIIAMFF